MILSKYRIISLLLYLVTIDSMWHPWHDPRQRAAEGIRKLPREEESSRGYTKAPEGRRDKTTFRRPPADQDDQRPTGFDRLLFLNMFKNSSRSLFRCPTLVRLRRLRQTFQDLPRWLPVIARKFPIVSQMCGRSTKNIDRVLSGPN